MTSWWRGQEVKDLLGSLDYARWQICLLAGYLEERQAAGVCGIKLRGPCVSYQGGPMHYQTVAMVVVQGMVVSKSSTETADVGLQDVKELLICTFLVQLRNPFLQFSDLLIKMDAAFPVGFLPIHSGGRILKWHFPILTTHTWGRQSLGKYMYKSMIGPTQELPYICIKVYQYVLVDYQSRPTNPRVELAAVTKGFTVCDAPENSMANCIKHMQCLGRGMCKRSP